MITIDITAMTAGTAARRSHDTASSASGIRVITSA